MALRPFPDAADNPRDVSAQFAVGAAQDTRTLGELLEDLKADGFAGSLRALSGGRVRCQMCRSTLAASQLHPAALRRLEGASDPHDMLAVAALVCPVCAERGTLVLGYGPAAAPEDSDVLRAFPDPDGRGRG